MMPNPAPCISLTALQAQELAFKLEVVLHEPDLLDSYGVSSDESAQRMTS